MHSYMMELIKEHFHGSREFSDMSSDLCSSKCADKFLGNSVLKNEYFICFDKL